jgi:hypothetical protein
MNEKPATAMIAASGEEFRDDVRKRLPPEALALLAVLIAAGLRWWHPLDKIFAARRPVAA